MTLEVQAVPVADSIEGWGPVACDLLAAGGGECPEQRAAFDIVHD